ncbi:MAG TPA: sialate O-acetylesterase [Opitutaceae bacterium]|nr:sialate O-acetylesterase [Opitutaceae bacterium]
MRKFLLLPLLAVTAFADITLAPLFSDHVVLQRDKPVPIWGNAEAGEHVEVTFAQETVGSTADANGRWVVVLSPLQASGLGAELVVRGKNEVRLQDVLVGDVWLCSGQSNMEFPVRRADNAAQEIAGANNALIRHFKVARAKSDTPIETMQGVWEVCSPTTVGEFTAVGYFFARDIQPRIAVPVGLINCTWGGTQIECWMSSAALSSEPRFAAVADNWKRMQTEWLPQKAAYDAALAEWQADEAAGKFKNNKAAKPRPAAPPANGPTMAPSSLFNAMINPAVPFSIRGILWYQGESNFYNPGEYGALFTAMIRSWRQHFGQGELPFYWVQLPNFKNGDPFGLTWAVLREEQAKALALPATGQAVAIDIGDANDIHPKNKQEVARRLALIARSQLYGAHVDASGPQFLSALREGNAMRVRFAHAGTGLTARDKPLQSLQIAGADRRFYPAAARIDRDTLIVSTPQVREPVAVRYAWFNAPDANLYNGAGLPAAPFRSDNW